MQCFTIARDAVAETAVKNIFLVQPSEHYVASGSDVLMTRTFCLFTLLFI